MHMVTGTVVKNCCACCIFADGVVFCNQNKNFDLGEVNEMEFIKTDRLIITPFDLLSLKAYYEGFDADVTKYQYPDPFATEDDARELLESFINLMDQGEMLFLSLFAEDNQFVGSIEIHGLKEEHPELGLWIKKEFQQRGYAYEALSNVIQKVNEDYDKEWYIYEADIRNTGSIKLVEKFTYRKERIDEFTTETGKELKLQRYMIQLK